MKDAIAVFDIGSNAVRLVVYGPPARAPVRLHNERDLCALGAGLAETGRLNTEGIARALASLRRFAALASALGVDKRVAVATAAVRDAADGPFFLKRVRDDCGLDVRVVAGEEEARLAALGVAMNGLGAGGIVGDYGGGSLELIPVDDTAQGVSLPIGSHRLQALASRAQRSKVVEAALDAAPFLPDFAGKDLVIIGGAWRSIARAHMHFSRHPLKVHDHYAMTGKKAAEFAALLAGQSISSLEKTVGLTKKRARDVSVAAVALEKVLLHMKPARVVCSATGLREGILFDALPVKARAEDPLLASCAAVAAASPRLKGGKAKILAGWMAPLFAPGEHRLVEAACHLSDIAALAHEDWQAEQAFREVLTFPFYGASHADRAFLALSVCARYRGYLRMAPREADEPTRAAQRVLGAEGTARALRCGLAMRLGWLLSGGGLPLLSDSTLELGPDGPQLHMGPTLRALDAGDVRQALAQLSAAPRG
jgi:exopolyphosphatase / guanosine-5'-triphosphate,3'-diphosphate pyrophosphatase